MLLLFWHKLVALLATPARVTVTERRLNSVAALDAARNTVVAATASAFPLTITIAVRNTIAAAGSARYSIAVSDALVA